MFDWKTSNFLWWIDSQNSYLDKPHGVFGQCVLKKFQRSSDVTRITRYLQFLHYYTSREIYITFRITWSKLENQKFVFRFHSSTWDRYGKWNGKILNTLYIYIHFWHDFNLCFLTPTWKFPRAFKNTVLSIPIYIFFFSYILSPSSGAPTDRGKHCNHDPAI